MGNNTEKKIRRKGKDEANARKGKGQQLQFNQKEQVLFNELIDFKDSAGKTLTNLSTDISRIDRQTNQFVAGRFTPLELQVSKFSQKIDVLIDKIIEINSLLNKFVDENKEIKFTDEEMEILELEIIDEKSDNVDSSEDEEFEKEVQEAMDEIISDKDKLAPASEEEEDDEND